MRRFHPHVELAYAAAYSLGNKPENNASLEGTQMQTSFNTIGSTREDDDEADDESVSTLLALPADTSSLVSRSKGLYLSSYRMPFGIN